MGVNLLSAMGGEQEIDFEIDPRIQHDEEVGKFHNTHNII